MAGERGEGGRGWKDDQVTGDPHHHRGVLQH